LANGVQLAVTGGLASSTHVADDEVDQRGARAPSAVGQEARGVRQASFCARPMTFWLVLRSVAGH